MLDEGCRIIFTTSPSLINATLKVAMENPEVNLLNCSAVHSFKHVNTYFGRIHEPRFLSGLVAGVMTRTGKLGYIAPFPVSDVLSGINAFTLGARMIRPDVQVYLEWMQTWDYNSATPQCTNRIAQQGADIICHHNTLANRQFSGSMGFIPSSRMKAAVLFLKSIWLCLSGTGASFMRSISGAFCGRYQTGS